MTCWHCGAGCFYPDKDDGLVCLSCARPLVPVAIPEWISAREAVRAYENSVANSRRTVDTKYGCIDCGEPRDPRAKRCRSCAARVLMNLLPRPVATSESLAGHQMREETPIGE